MQCVKILDKSYPQFNCNLAYKCYICIVSKVIKKVMKTITNIIGLLALIDLSIVMLTMANIATGKLVYHVQFFDEQIKFIMNIIS